VDLAVCDGPPEAVIKYHMLSINPSSLMPWLLITMTQTPPLAPVTPSIWKKTIDNCFLDGLCNEKFTYFIAGFNSSYTCANVARLDSVSSTCGLNLAHPASASVRFPGTIKTHYYRGLI